MWKWNFANDNLIFCYCKISIIFSLRYIVSTQIFHGNFSSSNKYSWYFLINIYETKCKIAEYHCIYTSTFISTLGIVNLKLEHSMWLYTKFLMMVIFSLLTFLSVFCNRTVWDICVNTAFDYIDWKWSLYSIVLHLIVKPDG